MTYCTVDDVRKYKGLENEDDDALLSDLVDRAQSYIDAYTARIFEAVASTRYFTAGADAVGRDLLFDEDLIELTSIMVNTDRPGGGQLLVENTHFVLLPRNRWPKYGVRLLQTSPYSWDYTTAAEMAVAVDGKWGYSISAPAAIQHAAVRLTAYFYAQKDSQVFETTAFPDVGMMTIPLGIPRDVKAILDTFRRPAL